jgi:hypothetical protein
MTSEPIEVPKSCKACQNVAAFKLLQALDGHKVFDEEGRQLHFHPLRKSFIVWFGDEFPEEVYATLKHPIPDSEAVEIVERENADKSPAEKLRLAQTYTLIRLAKPKDEEEFCRMQLEGLLDSLIEDHNSRTRPNSKAIGQ